MIEPIDSLQCLRSRLGGLGGGGIAWLEHYQVADCLVGSVQKSSHRTAPRQLKELNDCGNDGGSLDTASARWYGSLHIESLTPLAALTDVVSAWKPYLIFEILT